MKAYTSSEKSIVRNNQEFEHEQVLIIKKVYACMRKNVIFTSTLWRFALAIGASYFVVDIFHYTVRYGK